MANTLLKIVSFGFPMDDATFTYLMSGSFADDAAVAATVGKAVSLDATAANTVKLAPNDGVIFGRIYQAERRAQDGLVTVSVQRQFKEKLPAANAHGIVVGDSVQGAGAGLVEVAGAANDNIVVETGTDFVVVEKL